MLLERLRWRVESAPEQHVLPLVQPIWADTVVDSIGFSVHVNRPGVYRDAQAQIISRIAELGVRHLRSDLGLTTGWKNSQQAYTNGAGVKFLAVSGQLAGKPEYATQPTAAATVAWIEANLNPSHFTILGGPNEVNLPAYSGGYAGWQSDARAWMAELRDAVHASTVPGVAALKIGMCTIGANQVASGWALLGDAGNCDGLVDYGDIHLYPGGLGPDRNVPGAINNMRTYVNYSDPFMVSECGFHDAMDFPYKAGDHNPTPPAVAARYAARLFFEWKLAGAVRVTRYQFADEGAPTLADGTPNPLWNTDREQRFGVVGWNRGASITPKPEFYAWKNLIARFSDPGPTYTPPGLYMGVTSTRPGEHRHMVHGKRDGTVVVTAWRGGQNGSAVILWDPATKTYPTPTAASFTITLEEPKNWTVYEGSDLTGIVASGAGTSITVPYGAAAVHVFLTDSSSAPTVPGLPPTGKVYAGASTNGTVSTRYEPPALAAHRIFFQTDTPTAIATAVDAAVTANRWPIISVRYFGGATGYVGMTSGQQAQQATDLLALCNALRSKVFPTGHAHAGQPYPVAIAIAHEPENDAGANVTDWQATQAALDTAIAASGATNLARIAILMGSTVAGAAWSTWGTAAADADIIGMDFYAVATSSSAWQALARGQLTTALSRLTATGTPFGITEFASTQWRADVDLGGWKADILAFLDQTEAAGSDFACYFDNSLTSVSSDFSARAWGLTAPQLTWFNTVLRARANTTTL